jgi:hypothetical protein
MVIIIEIQWYHNVALSYIGWLNRKTATGAYMRNRFSRALFKLNNFAIFCPFAMFDSSSVQLD